MSSSTTAIWGAISVSFLHQRWEGNLLHLGSRSAACLICAELWSAAARPGPYTNLSQMHFCRPSRARFRRRLTPGCASLARGYLLPRLRRWILCSCGCKRPGGAPESNRGRVREPPVRVKGRGALKGRKNGAGYQDPCKVQISTPLSKLCIGQSGVEPPHSKVEGPGARY